MLRNGHVRFGGRAAETTSRKTATALLPDPFSYLWTLAGFCYVAFVVDVFSRRILGWRVTTTKHTGMVTDALRQALQVRRRGEHDWVAAGLIHHSDAGSQGGLQGSSQHLECGGGGWDGLRAGVRSRLGEPRCGRRAGRRSTSEACSGSFGDGSPRACRARRRLSGAACQPRLERAGSVTVVACHRSAWPSRRGVTCPSPTVKRSRS